jgi:hypothetical protein
MVFLATVQVVIFGWIIGIDKGIASAHQGAKIKIPKVYAFIIKYITPCLLIFILCNWLWDIISSLYKNGSNGSANSYINDLVINPNPVALQSVGILLLLGLSIAWAIKSKVNQ